MYIYIYRYTHTHTFGKIVGKWDVQRYMIWAKYGDLGIYGDHMGIYGGNEE